MMVNKKIRQSLNKAFLKVKLLRQDINKFKDNLEILLKITDKEINEKEEFHKNNLTTFLKDTYYSTNHYINTQDNNDLVIYNGKNINSKIGVIIETKRPHNTREMITSNKFNCKALQQLLFYYLRERITNKNFKIKHLIITNIYDWFVFRGDLFERLFYQDKFLVKQFNDFQEKRLTSEKTKLFYEEIAFNAINKVELELKENCVNFNLKDYEKEEDFSLTLLYKFLSPQHLLKLPFANDSNSLDQGFYSELLHIIGLTEIKQGSKKLIERLPENKRYQGSLLENTIYQLDTYNKLDNLTNLSDYGNNNNEQLFNIALELVITWINRILFLKLLEAQLINYNQQDKNFAFLHHEKIKNFNDLDSLFFQVLAKKVEERKEDIQNKFYHVPYLNSSLFEMTELENKTIAIGSLNYDDKLPFLPTTILKDSQGKRKTSELNTLQYLFDFLSAYDFSSESKGEIQEENKKLINASVLGLIFEKINGYKDGSFFTPSFITMYMCRETIHRTVIQKFNEIKGWNCQNIDDLYNKIEDRKEANYIINSLKICDPAVGSGHFLVSALNEIIALKSYLEILEDKQGKRLKNYTITVENDELIISDEDNELFVYNPRNQESQRIQETLFHEKQTIIENCLFGVDININSVKICRLRLWIELLKNAYYIISNKPPKSSTLETFNHSISPPELGAGGRKLETLPNIDINIKCGNSLISRFDLSADLTPALKKNKLTIDDYKQAVKTYHHPENKQEKQHIEKLINQIKSNFTMAITGNDVSLQKLRKLEGDLNNLLNQTSLFTETAKEKKAKGKKQKDLEKEINKLTNDIEDKKNNRLYHNAFEWRFEFPEVLNDDGEFIGFDIIIGNPPYGVTFKEVEKNYYKQIYSISSQGKIDSFKLFYERAYQILRYNYFHSYIIPNTFLYNTQSKNLREFILNNTYLFEGIELRKGIFNDAPDVITVVIFAKFTKPKESYLTSVKVASAYYKYSNFDKDEWEISQQIPYKTFINDSEKKINLRRNFYLDKIIEKINIHNNLGFFFSVKQGTKPYGDKDKKDIKLISNDKEGDDWEIAINGRNISQYHINLENIYVKRCLDLHSCLSKEIVYEEKIYFQRMRKISLFPRIVACYDNANIHGLYTCSVIYNNKKSKLNLKYLLAILNSLLINIWFKNFDTDIEIKLISIKSIPIPNISVESQQPFIDLVTKILNLKEENPDNDTTELEKEIDLLIYKLYELTEEEINIIEGK